MRKRPPKAVLDYLRQQGKSSGALGGKTAAANMTHAERKARATKASQAAAVVRTAKKKAKDKKAKG
jgi:hypothetical protein